MILKSRVLGGDKGIVQIWRQLVKVDVDTVTLAAVVSSHLLASSGVDGRGELVGGVLELVNLGHIADNAVIDKDKQEQQQCGHPAKDHPHAFHNLGVMPSPLGFLHIRFTHSRVN